MSPPARDEVLIESVLLCRWSDPDLADIDMPRDRMRLTRSLTSGLCRSPADPPGTFWGVGDRGPNLKPKPAVARYGLDHLQALCAIDGAKIMPLPAAGPALGRFRIEGETIVLEALIELTDADGRAIGGLPVPCGPSEEFEPAYDLAGARLDPDPNGVDSEGIAALRDGNFWIAEEYGPSLLRVGRDGRVACRWVPVGSGPRFEGATYPVAEMLPAIAGARKLNRGFEAIAVSEDEASILVAFQSPLAHPDREAHERGRHVRIWRLDAASGALIAEYVYPLDRPASFRRDCAAGKVGRDDIKISEILLLADDRLLVLERVSLSTKIYCVTLEGAAEAPASLSDRATRPTLEQMSREELEQADVPVLTKTLLLSTDDHPEICGDLEGMILLSPNELLLANDNDFGVEGVETQFWLVRFGHAID